MTGKLLFFFSTLILLLGLNACKRPSLYTNALINESSPYLLQHAHNPVNWYPWGDAALAKADSSNQLIIISIGYAACHWCHVMEAESYEDTTVARIMNEHFISIKVDREERPDVDAIYLDACQLATGEPCGWPLNVFALPDGRPVWAGTYFPKKNWLEILEYFVNLYRDEPEKLENYADRLLEGIQNWNQIPLSDTEDFSFSATKFAVFLDSITTYMDAVHGGFLGAPKFPLPNVQELLLQASVGNADGKVLQLAEVTLQNISRGGIYDQLGGGFARYSTDNLWQVPHFEKMLYDNAQLVALFAQAFSLTGKKEYAEIARESLQFVENELTDPSGGFYSSLDADSDGEEGKYYVWTQEELEQLLPEGSPRDLFLEYYQISPAGNWENGKNIFFRKEDLKTFSQSKNVDLESVQKPFAEFQNILLEARGKRVRPALDDKILTSWNALMLSAYVEAYRYLGEEEYLETALRSAHFLEENRMQPDGQLFRSRKVGHKNIPAFLDDYALLAQAYLSLFEVTFDEKWLDLARKLAEYTLEHFYSDEQQFFYFNADTDSDLITRKVELNDQVIPASNSVMAEVLYDLSLLYYEPQYEQLARKMLKHVVAIMEDMNDPASYSNWLQLYQKMMESPFEIAIVGPEYEALRREMMQNYLSDALFLGGASEGGLKLLKGKLQAGATYIYVCKEKVCRLPVKSVPEALEQLDYINSNSSSSNIR